MTNNKNLKAYLNSAPDYGIFLKAGEKLPQKLIEQLAEANKKYSKTKNFPAYRKDIGEIFKLKNVQPNEKTILFLAGFVEGEGSLNVGAKKNKTSRFKVYLDPEFSVTQHVNGISNLYALMTHFKTGRIRHKNGSNATMIYVIDNRQNLEEKVLPFFEKHVNPIGSPVKKRRYNTFKKLLNLFNEQAHLNYERMMYEVLPLWDSMRMQVGQRNETFKSLEDAQEYVKAAYSLYLKSKEKT